MSHTHTHTHTHKVLEIILGIGNHMNGGARNGGTVFPLPRPKLYFYYNDYILPRGVRVQAVGVDEAEADQITRWPNHTHASK